MVWSTMKQQTFQLNALALLTVNTRSKEPASSRLASFSGKPKDCLKARNHMIKVTKLPPGEAYGARDLQNWSNNRMTGRSGSGSRKDDRNQLDRAKQLSVLAEKTIKGFDGSVPKWKKKKYKPKRHGHKPKQDSFAGGSLANDFFEYLGAEQDNLVWDLVAIVEEWWKRQK